MARIVSDGGYVRYIADVVVHPDYQGCGIGKAMINQIMEHIRRGKREDERILVCLMAAKGKEPFYKKCGLEERPNEGHGAGMSIWIE
jgi:GNAT superfamily N-acetyltransferase